MCGIFGGFNIGENTSQKAIELINRGDDGITIKKIDENLFFAARRHLVKKSGNDEKSKSDQPYFSNDKSKALIFNGEFYNFEDYKKKLKNSETSFISSGDTEVLLRLFEKKGIDFLKDKKIDSLFAIAIYDKKNKIITIARDWPGRIPLYYYHDSEKFIFSSELKAFKAVKNLSLQKPIELTPGTYVEYSLDTKKIEIFRYFTPNNSLIKKNENIMDIGSKIHNLLDESAKNRTMGDVPICTMLSGGIDSVLTTFYVFKNLNFKKIGYKPKSFVFSVEGYESIDVKRARIAAESFKEIDLELVEVTSSRENLIENVPNIIESFEMRKMKALSFYPLPIYWYLAPKMRDYGFKVTIGGHGVDELLGAYDSWKELNKGHEVQIQSKSRMAFINNIYNNMLKRASIIFMNRGPIEARFPFLNQNVCEYLLSIDKKWLQINKENCEILLKLIDEKQNENLGRVKKNLVKYYDDKFSYEEKNNEEYKNLEKIFWKFPLLVSSYIASKNSFLKFDQVFNPKHRGQHGAGITSLEKDIVKYYKNLGRDDTEIFKNIANEKFK